MTIARQFELTLLGDADRKREICDGLQGLGAVHLVPLNGTTGEPGPDLADDARTALTYLQNTRRKRRSHRPIGEPDLKELVDDVLRNKFLREDVVDRIELIRQRRRILKPWGDFKLPPLEQLGGYRLWFYLVPVGKEAGLESISLPWKIVNSNQRFHDLVVIARDEPDLEQVPYQRVHTGSRSLSELDEMLEETLIELEELNAERDSLTRWIGVLQDSLNQILDRRDLNLAERQAMDAGELFAVRGWIPQAAEPLLAAWIETVPAAYTLREPTAEDAPPTLLENDDRLGGGQVAVSFFQLPGYSNWDPSRLIFVSFSIFFAMIMADAGYGLLMGVVLLFFWRRMSEPGSTAIRLRNMWASIAGCCTIYGVMVGSYFGVSAPPGTVLGSLVVLDLKDFDTMMRLSIAVGVLHLSIAHAAVFWTNRGTRVGMVALAWLVGVVSGFGLWMDYVARPDFQASTSVFTYGLLAWLAMLVLFSGQRPFDSAKNIALNVGAGIGALTGLTKAFGDVLSYMRLFALGLAGSSLAATFNSLAVSARDASEHAGFLFFLLIVLLGHTLNIVLTLMSGVIHGLRLNLMEFYNWGIRDEGYPFIAFAKRGDSKWKSS